MANSPVAPSTWPLGAIPRLDAPLPEAMQALTIHRDQYGPPASAIRMEMVAAPRLRVNDAGRVLVAILASGPNFNTNFAALGLPVPVFGRGDSATVHIPGSDALGIVVDAGAGVTRAKIGQAVILDSWTGNRIRGYETHDGFNGQFAAIEEDRVIPVTGSLRTQAPERLAAMLLAYGTAYRAIVERLCVRPGDSVLILGGGKGTSFAGAQIAKALGARVILVGSNPGLMQALVDRHIADAFIDRRALPSDVFGVVPADATVGEWEQRTESFRKAVRDVNGGQLVTKVFEHTGGENFPLLVSAIAPGGALAFFGATGKGLKGEYKETFFHDGRRFVFDARWVWMRQKQVLFRSGSAADILAETGLLPGRNLLVWGADRQALAFVRAGLERSANVAVIASKTKESHGVAELASLGLPAGRVLDRDGFVLPEDMPDPLTEDGLPNKAYAADYMTHARALGKALWSAFGGKQSPDVVIDRSDHNRLHFSTFVARDFDETDVRPCGIVVVPSRTNLDVLGSHMYGREQAHDVVRLLAAGTIAMEQEDLDVTDLGGLADMQQRMLDGTMRKPKGVALVQADRAGRPIAEFESAFLGTPIVIASPAEGRFLDIRLLGTVALVTLTRPETLNALNAALVSQIAAMVDELAASRTIKGHAVSAVIMTGDGRSFVAGADVNEFQGTAQKIEAFAWENISGLSKLEQLSIPVVSLIDGFALGGGNELAMSTHYRIATENARFGQPEIKLGIIPGYGGLQRLPRLVGPVIAARLCINGEPIDGHEAVTIGLADEFAPSAYALRRAFAIATQLAEGQRPLRHRNWDGLAKTQREALRELLAEVAVQVLRHATTPEAHEAGNLRLARQAAARDVLLAIEYGYANGFEAGLRNDARLFGAVAASPGGQEWIGRFLKKDAKQSSMLILLPETPFAAAVGPGQPVAK